MFKLCRFVLENSYLTTDELKKIDGKSFKKALEMGYIVEENNYYQLSEEGLKYLQNYKVDNAIILASGFGSRFIPFTYDTPHGLLEVRGEPLVERQIKQLNIVGIYDITIVVGYLADQFEYLVDKYDVKLVFNDDFGDRDFMSSLKSVKDKINNTYILTADLYVGENVLHKYEKDSWYGALFNETLAQANFPILDENDNFVGIGKRQTSHQWILKGPIFVNQDFSKVIKDNISKAGNSLTEFFNTILIDSSMDLLDLKAHEIFRLDTLESLRAFDRTYLSPGKHESLDIISHVFKVKQDEIFDIAAMKDGMTNNSFLFTDVLITREQEFEVYNTIKDLNISDEIIYIDPSKGYKITRFYEGIRTLDDRNFDEVKESIGIIRMLHNSQLSVKHHFNLEERINFYKMHCELENAKYYDGFDETYSKIKKIMEFIASLDRPLCLCHIDSVSENFLVLDDGSQKLIDWEYSGMSDPLVDIAMFSIYAEYDDAEVDKVFDIYTQGKGSDLEQLVYYSYISLASFLWTLWTNYKEALGENFGDYGMNQFRICNHYAEKVVTKLKAK